MFVIRHVLTVGVYSSTKEYLMSTHDFTQDVNYSAGWVLSGSELWKYVMNTLVNPPFDRQAVINAGIRQAMKPEYFENLADEEIVFLIATSAKIIPFIENGEIKDNEVVLLH
jgi:hypothetical protein